MFDSSLDFFALVIAIAAFIFARKAFNQMDALRTRLNLMETLATQTRASQTRASQTAASTPAAAQPTPPPLPAQEELRALRQPQATAELKQRRTPRRRHHRRRRLGFQKFQRPHPHPVPASRSVSAPAGWSGSAV